MALIDKASLLFVPSVVAQEKAFNILPSGNRAPDSTGENSGYDQTRADFDFDRGSNTAATRVNADGLIEKYRENKLLQSNNFSDSDWEKSDVTIASGFEGYDGTNNAWELTRTATAYARMNQAVTQSGVYTHSIYAKAGTLNFISIGPSGGGEGTWFNLSDGTIGVEGGLIKHSSIESVGNGWYRISVVVNNPSNQWFRFYPSDVDGGDESATATGTIYVQNAQLETGMVATDYLDSTSVTGKAGVLIDLPRIDYSSGAGALLLEPSRQQLVQYSEWLTGSFALENVSVDLNNTTSPEGVQNALKITDDANTGYHKITDENLFVADGTMRTWSVFVKKGTSRYCVISHAKVFSSAVNSLIFDMEDGVYTNEGNTDYFDIVHDPISMGNGWWRIGFSSDINSSSYDNFSIGVSQGPTWSGNVSYTGDGSLNFYTYGAQLEAGSYSTSYIPNHGESGGVTRAADLCNNGGSAESINSVEGVLYAEIAALADDEINRHITLWDGTDTNRLVLKYDNQSNVVQVFNRVGGIETAFLGHSLADITISHKIAVRYKANDYALVINGVEVDTDTSSSTWSVSVFNDVKFSNGSGSDFYGNVKQLAVFNEALTNEELATLTTL